MSLRLDITSEIKLEKRSVLLILAGLHSLTGIELDRGQNLSAGTLDTEDLCSILVRKLGL
jgi:hypothetical protein